MTAALINYAAGVLILIGAVFALTAAIGLLRLPDFYTRTHAASKAGTLGSCSMLLALAILALDFATSTRALAGILFFLMTAPVAAHLLAKAAHAAGYRLGEGAVRDDLVEADHPEVIDFEPETGRKE
jgi:multicomponent Na+:H+ antiporter subunit G